MATKPPPPTSKAPPAKPLGKPTGPKAPPSAGKVPARVAKSFSIAPWSGQGEGEKVLIFGGSGMGKTTLAAMLANAVFIGIDDGARKIGNPLTGQPVMAIRGAETYADVRDALHSKGLWDGRSLVLDTVTKLEDFATRHVVENVRTDKNLAVRSIEGFGYGKGYRHVYDHMKAILGDLDVLVRGGTNVILLAQENAVTVANSEGLDYIQDGPKLQHQKQCSVRHDYCEWADHVLRIGFLETKVAGDEETGRGKLSTQDTTRCVYTSGSRHFIAKTRTMSEWPVISFENNKDDSLWKIMFPA